MSKPCHLICFKVYDRINPSNLRLQMAQLNIKCVTWNASQENLIDKIMFSYSEKGVQIPLCREVRFSSLKRRSMKQLPSLFFTTDWAKIKKGLTRTSWVLSNPILFCREGHSELWKRYRGENFPISTASQYSFTEKQCLVSKVMTTLKPAKV